MTGHTKHSLSMCQVENHVHPDLASGIISTTYMLRIAFLQECVSYFAIEINMLLLQWAPTTVKCRS
jgi:hypothetical protein